MGPPDTWRKMAAWLGQLGASVGARPKAVVVISGHWEAEDFTVTSGAHPPLIYDYSGFPPQTYALEYPAPGSPALAERIVGLLGQAGIPARSDAQRGFDHGVFIPCKVIYPQADVPIVQLSLKAGLDPATHRKAGRALAPLRKEGVLIAGSGMSYHNLGGLMSGGVLPDSDRFDTWLTQRGLRAGCSRAGGNARTMGARPGRSQRPSAGRAFAAAHGGVRRRCRRPGTESVYRPGDGCHRIRLSLRLIPRSRGKRAPDRLRQRRVSGRATARLRPRPQASRWTVSIENAGTHTAM